MRGLRSGVRLFVTYPILSIAAVLTLGLGIGLASTIFSIVNGALVKGLPFEHAERVVALVGIRATRNDWESSLAIQDVALWQARQHVFEWLGPYETMSVNLSGEASRPERVSAARLSVAAFQVLHVKPLLGRGLEPGDDRLGAPPVALLGYDIWRDRFHGSPAALGQTIRTDGEDRTVIGVMPARFGFPELQRLWVPLQVNPDGTPRGQGPYYQVLGRLKPDVSMKEAAAQVKLIAGQLAREFPKTNQGLSADVWPFTRTALGPEVFGFLYTALGAGIGVLLIACVNVSNLLIARASLRWREVAVRMAIGAGRGDVIRQHLAEILLLAILGGVLGIGITMAGMRWFNGFLAADPPPFWMTFDLDAHVLAFVAGIVFVSSLAAGLLPSLHSSRVNASTVLRDDSRSATGTRLGRFSAALVVIEIAISCGLLMAAGVMTKSVVQLKSIQMPFAVDNIVTMRIDLPNRAYSTAAARRRFFDQLLLKVQAIPGVEATLSDVVPGQGIDEGPVQIEGRVYARESDYPTVHQATIGPRYFDTFRVPIVRGRAFLASDTSESPPVAILNESVVRTLFAGVDPIGRRLRGGGADSKEPWLTVVGVVPDLLLQGVGNNSTGEGYYVPLAQHDRHTVRMAVRTSANVGAALPLVRAALGSIDRDIPMDDVMTVRDFIQRSTWFYTVFGTLFLAFGCSGLLLSAAGLYGVMSFAVTQRTREMGVRSALGASPAGLVRLIMRRSLVQLAVGLILGVALGLAAAGPLQVVLYRVNPRDPVVLVIVVATLAVTCVLASLVPAWRVTRIDPTVALSAE